MFQPIAKILAAMLECFAVEEPVKFHADSTMATVTTEWATDGAAITIDAHWHFMGSEALGECLKSSIK